MGVAQRRRGGPPPGEDVVHRQLDAVEALAVDVAAADDRPADAAARIPAARLVGDLDAGQLGGAHRRGDLGRRRIAGLGAAHRLPVGLEFGGDAAWIEGATAAARGDVVGRRRGGADRAAQGRVSRGRS